MSEALELEIHLFRRDPSSYHIELRLLDLSPKIQQERAPVRGVVTFNFNELRMDNLDAGAYGKQLFDDLMLSNPKLVALYDDARNLQSPPGGEIRPLRVRLYIDRDASELHDLRWETLRDPRNNEWLLGQDDIRFSRFLGGDRSEPIEPRARGAQRALVILAGPQGLGQGQYVDYAPVRIQEERERAAASLGNLFSADDVLATDPALPVRVTMTAIRTRLRRGYEEHGAKKSYEVIYMACHGGLITAGERRGPILLLENEQGEPEIVRGADLVDEVHSLEAERRPRLFVLASCQSAGAGAPVPAPAALAIPEVPAVQEPATADESGSLAALGPSLSQAGVPAVLAMQGSVSMTTAGTFLQEFFTDLTAPEPAGGLVDKAAAVARSAVHNRPDFWMPVIFTRLRGGKLWYSPGFAGEFDQWPGLIDRIKNHKTTPIIGVGLFEQFCGPLSKMSRELAEKESYPLAQHGRSYLYQVAQFLTYRYDPNKPQEYFLDYLQKRIGALLQENIAGNDGEQVQGLLKQVAAKRRAENPNNGHEVLARLPFDVYIVASPDDLLEHALKANNKKPVVDYLRWNTVIQNRLEFPSVYEREHEQNSYTPDDQHPLVYHLFGRLEIPESLILTEEQYFDYLMIVQREKLIPEVIISKWIGTTLLFLGFQSDDWIFRVLFRSILDEGRRTRNKMFKTVTMQISPEETSLDPLRARRHLEHVYQEAKISVYWGNPDEFLGQLWALWLAGGNS